MAVAAAHRARGLRTILLHTIVWVLFWIDRLCKKAFYAWSAFRHGARKAKPGGSNPPVPKVLGIVIAEDNVADISLRTVANIAAWCMSYGVQHLQLYDPSGHLKRSQQVLAHDLALTAAKEGSTVIIKCGWSPSLSASSTIQEARIAPQQTTAAPVPHQLSSSDTYQICSHNHTSAGTDTTLDAGKLSSKEVQHQERPCKCYTQQHKQPLGLKACQGQSTDNVCVERAAATAACAAAACTASKSDCGPAVAVRLLAAEDAYEPVIIAALERCAPYIIPGSSPKANSIVQQFKEKHLPNNTMDSTFSSMPGSLLPSSSLLDAQNGECDALSESESLVSADEDQDISSSSCSSSSQLCRGDSLPASCSSLCDADGSAAVEDVECLSEQPQQACSRCQETDEQQQHVHRQEAVPDQQQDCQQRDQHHKERQGGQGLHNLKQQTLRKQRQPLTQLKISVPTEQLPQEQQPKQLPCQQDGSILQELAPLVDADILQEPQLLLVYGPVLSLAGYPPFHTRVCEVQHMGQLAKANRQAVADAIAAYCKVLQRHGA